MSELDELTPDLSLPGVTQAPLCKAEAPKVLHNYTPPAVEDGAELREAVARIAGEAFARHRGAGAWRSVADAIIAGPIADLRARLAKVERRLEREKDRRIRYAGEATTAEANLAAAVGALDEAEPVTPRLPVGVSVADRIRHLSDLLREAREGERLMALRAGDEMDGAVLDKEAPGHAR